ncbi:pilus assembly protein [Paracoccaceae bacterium Fryx2]|nr:pilus assembly protein [Paracoccaceae bacterium Fryx2]
MTQLARLCPRPFRRFATRVAAVWTDESGSPVVEFALLAPFFLLIVTAAFDIGLVIHARFNLAAQVSAAASYSQMKGLSIADDDAAAFAGGVAAVLSAGSTSMEGTVMLNNASRATVKNGVVATADSGGDMAQCYCPTRVDGRIQWGGARTCRVPCSDGSAAGRFIEVSASTQYISLFGGYGMTEDGSITANAVVRLE